MNAPKIFYAHLCECINLNFGLQEQVTVKYLTMATGIAWFVMTGLHIFLYCWKPELFGTYQAPAAGLEYVV
jgi:hypothetical protein